MIFTNAILRKIPIDIYNFGKMSEILPIQMILLKR